ncbi:MAG: hypothetical protein MZV64_12460 [Ignavibacteriales bacterium]|nr:hypothetical protein [Ignavibacteriales bacterium]
MTPAPAAAARNISTAVCGARKPRWRATAPSGPSRAALAHDDLRLKRSVRRWTRGFPAASTTRNTNGSRIWARSPIRASWPMPWNG